ncbi:CDP-glycerol glycerophosphotransferase [Kribbella orskensis]|uniref:CDP-glycerol glycerophosphotransferase n=1 Tax=Kribbella orskensis TaxID=2512216 RepID=A0ABY2BJ38_9ACTN|nr:MULTISPECIES: glycosyltransferase family 2 protein [Kribbella]TCN39197.1 CDP-glycerol glycerophosphotransferase [Kribbella sp. VKM Ac-2500]TCO21844.1 CDP-glycerol glycerophosphotransferase [Kribbella orskensis]
MTPRLSVVVPFYNVGDYIGDCLDSIARQTWTDFEAILVDDGSPDDSAAIAKDLCSRDSRFRIVEQDNQGLGPARNTGVRHAQGEYLTFVDSDDLVSRHGFERLVRSLDETGSSFAGGNARRFNNSAGVRPSWIHGLPFAKNRIASHVLESPDLILDRMVWNKVYRRSFWDEYGYEFPAIRYEDYPVTLKAHLDAVTVDALAAPVYYWRERESGESITQQKFQLSNLEDRVRSAELVMDLIDSGAYQGLGEIRRRVHSHFTQIDMLTLVMAFGAVPPAEEQNLVLLACRLLERLDNSVLVRAHSYDRIQHSALRAGDVDLLRRLAHFRNEGGLRGGARAIPKAGSRWQFEHNYPGVHEQNTAVPRTLYELPKKDLTLATTVQRVAWQDDVLSLHGTAEIRHLETTASSSLRIALVVAGNRIPLPVRRYAATDSHGDSSLVGFEVRLDRRLLTKLADTAAPAHFAVRMKSGRLREHGKLRGQRAGSPGWPPGNWIDETTWVQPGPGADGAFVLRKMVDPCRITSAEQTSDALVLRGRVPADLEDPRLQVTRALSGLGQVLPLEWSGRDFSVRIPFGPIIAETSPDDPFTQRTTWAFRMLGSGGDERLLLWTAGDQAVSHLDQGRLVTLTRSTGGYVNLHEGPARVVAQQAEVVAESNELRIAGLLTGGAAFSWRRFLEDSDEHLDVACRSTVSASGEWVASVGLSELIPDEVVAHSVDPLASLADWVLFATAADGSAQAVQCEPFLASRLPIEVEQGGHVAGIRPHAGTLHVEVR